MYRFQETDTKHVLYKDRKVRWKARPFQPNEEMFAESCSVRYKDLFRTKKNWGFIGTLIVYSRIVSQILCRCVFLFAQSRKGILPFSSISLVNWVLIFCLFKCSWNSSILFLCTSVIVSST